MMWGVVRWRVVGVTIVVVEPGICFSATPSWLWLMMLPREDGRAIANGKDFFTPWVNTT